MSLATDDTPYHPGRSRDPSVARSARSVALAMAAVAVGWLISAVSIGQDVVDLHQRFQMSAVASGQFGWPSSLRWQSPATTSDPAVQKARQALEQKSGKWYDKPKAKVVPVAPHGIGETREEAEETDRRFSVGSGLGSIMQVFGVVTLLVVLGVLASLVALHLLKTETQATKISTVVQTARDVDRVEQLPYQLRKTDGDLLGEARRLYEHGNYSEAIIFFYSHLLLELDRYQVIRLAKGKTNRQYLRETRPRPLLSGPLESTMVAFEDVFFGHHDLDRERFETCWQMLTGFERELRTTGAMP